MISLKSLHLDYLCGTHLTDVSPSVAYVADNAQIGHAFSEIENSDRDVVLVSHNTIRCPVGDVSITQRIADMMPRQIKRWFTCNVDCNHPKITPIPLGYANTYHKHRDFGEVIRRMNRPKRKLLLACFAKETNTTERGLAHDAVRDRDWVTDQCFDHYQNKAMPYGEYLDAIADHHFTLSPPGNGLDCHRTWEALYLGSIPVVKNNAVAECLEGLPHLKVDDWSQVTLDLLVSTLLDIREREFDWQRLFSSYWIKQFQQETA